jgi:hypothetical protein
MVEGEMPGREFARALEAAFERVASEVAAPEGRVLLGELPLRRLMDERLDATTRELLSASELILSIADGEPQVLVHYALRVAGQPDWDWSLDSFRIGRRGYIALILGEEDDAPFQPIYGAWEPHDSQAAFETCFIGVYAARLDPILFGTHLWLGPTVTRDLLKRALWAGLERESVYRWEQLRDYALPLDTIAGRRATLDYYVENAREP